MQILCKALSLTSKQTESLSIRSARWLMLNSKLTGIYFKNHMETNKLFGTLHILLLNVKTLDDDWDDDTYLLTPWSRVLLEKLTGFAANQEIPRILWNPKVHYRTHKHLSLSLANSTQSPQPLPTSWKSILILSSHLRLGLTNGLFPWGFPTKTLRY